MPNEYPPFENQELLDQLDEIYSIIHDFKEATRNVEEGEGDRYEKMVAGMFNKLNTKFIAIDAIPSASKDKFQDLLENFLPFNDCVRRLGAEQFAGQFEALETIILEKTRQLEQQKILAQQAAIGLPLKTMGRGPINTRLPPQSPPKDRNLCYLLHCSQKNQKAKHHLAACSIGNTSANSIKPFL